MSPLYEGIGKMVEDNLAHQTLINEKFNFFPFIFANKKKAKLRFYLFVQ